MVCIYSVQLKVELIFSEQQEKWKCHWSPTWIHWEMDELLPHRNSFRDKCKYVHRTFLTTYTYGNRSCLMVVLGQHWGILRDYFQVSVYQCISYLMPHNKSLQNLVAQNNISIHYLSASVVQESRSLAMLFWSGFSHEITVISRLDDLKFPLSR